MSPGDVPVVIVTGAAQGIAGQNFVVYGGMTRPMIYAE